MKKTIRYPDGRVEEIEGTAEEFRELEKPVEVDLAQPHPFIPGVTIKTTDSVTYPSQQVIWPNVPETCAIEAYFKAHPDAPHVSLYCGCRRCSVWCGTTDPIGLMTSGGISYEFQS